MDTARAASLYARACDGGELEGCVSLGVLIEEGRGVTEEEGRAATLYTRACEAGIVRACGNLAGLHLRGAGVPKDEVRAVALYKTACDGGHRVACETLCTLFDEGRGVAKDEFAPRSGTARPATRAQCRAVITSMPCAITARWAAQDDRAFASHTNCFTREGPARDRALKTSFRC